jgi:hypothetical protein
MRRSTIIATCLVNSKMIRRLEDAEAAVAAHFRDFFPGCAFVAWNSEVDNRVAEQIIRNVGRASQINVVKFIKDLGDPCSQ